MQACCAYLKIVAFVVTIGTLQFHKTLAHGSCCYDCDVHEREVTQRGTASGEAQNMPEIGKLNSSKRIEETRNRNKGNINEAQKRLIAERSVALLSVFWS